MSRREILTYAALALLTIATLTVLARILVESG